MTQQPGGEGLIPTTFFKACMVAPQKLLTQTDDGLLNFYVGVVSLTWVYN